MLRLGWHKWWVDEIRTNDGDAGVERIHAYGPTFRTLLGETCAGDVVLDLVGEGGGQAIPATAATRCSRSMGRASR